MPGPAPGPSGYFVRAVAGTPVMRLARTLDNSAWLPGMYGAVFRANKLIAARVQAKAIEILHDELVRPGQSTGKLEEAISGKGAVYADGSKIIIGVGAEIEKTAPYWRLVEEGMDPLQHVAFGFWTEAGRGEGGAVPLGPPSKDIRTGRPIIVSFNAKPGRFAYTWAFSKGIEPHLFFTRAWEEIKRSGFIRQAYAESFARTRGPSGRPLSFGRSFGARFGHAPSAADFGV